jgi:subtilisin-like proprotein convertase family protein
MFTSSKAFVRSLALGLVASLAAVAGAQTYTSPGSIAIPVSGAASPYPSQITVSQGPTSIAGFSVTLQGVSHTYPQDLQVCLVSPSGVGILLLNRNGNANDLLNANLTFAFEGQTLGSQTLGSGTYRPAGGLTASFSTVESVNSLPQLQESNANGVWSLYVVDTAGGDAGSIASWSINFTDAPVSLAQQTLTYQGRLDGGLTDGNIDIRYSVWSTPSGTAEANRVTPDRLALNVPLQAGVFSANLPLQTALSTAQASFLQLEVANPAGSAFVPLTPRQIIRPAPLANRAASADFAANAGTATSASTATNATNAQNAVRAQSAATADTAATAQSAASVPWSGLTGQPIIADTAVGNDWQLRLNNGAAPAFRGAMRLSDGGFLELTNRADTTGALFARLSSVGTWTAASDSRLKTNVTAATGNLAAAMRLRPVNFRWNETGMEDFGLIAQEVRAVLPGMVTGDEAKQMLTVNYSQLSVVAIGAIQELKAENDALRARLERLERVTGVSADR